MVTWTPNVSGSLTNHGIATNTATYKTVKIVIETGNPFIGNKLVSLSLTWEAQNSPPASGTWQVKHYLADDTLISTGSTIVAPPASATLQVFTASGTTPISTGDYITWSCLQTDDNKRDPVFATYANSTDSALYTSTVLTAGYSVDYVALTLTSSEAPSSTGTRLPPPPITVRF